jgi:hypothetical protein
LQLRIPIPRFTNRYSACEVTRCWIHFNLWCHGVGLSFTPSAGFPNRTSRETVPGISSFFTQAINGSRLYDVQISWQAQAALFVRTPTDINDVEMRLVPAALYPPYHLGRAGACAGCSQPTTDTSFSFFLLSIDALWQRLGFCLFLSTSLLVYFFFSSSRLDSSVSRLHMHATTYS